VSIWGKIVGGVAGFAMGGPLGAVMGAALGHAADSGAISPGRLGAPFAVNGANLAALLGNREQLFSIAVVVLSAKLAKADGPVNRAEIDAFKRLFRIPPEAVHDVGRLFDQARDSADGAVPFAERLGEAFADNRAMLEDVLAALFAIARADAPVNAKEHAFLEAMHRAMGLSYPAWERAAGGAGPRGAETGPDPYAVLGVERSASDGEIRQAWRKLMRENHPDTLAARGVPPEFIDRATAKVAEFNAAWNAIKRERNL